MCHVAALALNAAINVKQRAESRLTTRAVDSKSQSPCGRIAEASVDQARKPLEKHIAGAQAVAETRSARMSVMRLHRKYMQAQMRAVSEQASEMRQIMHRKAMNATKQKS